MSKTTTPPSKRRGKQRALSLGLNASVFTKAARVLVESRRKPEFACLALSQAQLLSWDSYNTPYHRYFEAVLDPRNGCSAWYCTGPRISNDWQEQLARTLGLLLCAELVREDFVPEGWTP